MGKYTIEDLIALSDQYKSELIGEYPKVTWDTIITFKCICHRQAEKKFGSANTYGLLCKECCERKRREKSRVTQQKDISNDGSNRIVYTKELLDKLLIEHEATLNEIPVKYSSTAIINYKCKCGNDFEKKLNSCHQYGMKCSPCAQKAKFEKVKKVMKEKYGVENAMHKPELKQKQEKTVEQKYGVKNVSLSEDVQARIRESNLKNHGVEYTMQSEAVREKGKETLREKYGVENAMHLSETKEKIKATCKERYGEEHALQNPDILAKQTATNLERHGCENVMQNEEIAEKRRLTFLAKYNCEFPSQNPELFEKQMTNSLRRKSYTLPSGNKIFIQGYEPFAIDELLKNHDETQIQTGSCMKLLDNKCYIEYNLDDGSYHRYFPDIFIPRENLIIEVKSEWTFKHPTGKLEFKAKASKAAGFKFQVWIYDEKGNKTVIEY